MWRFVLQIFWQKRPLEKSVEMDKNKRILTVVAVVIVSTGKSRQSSKASEVEKRDSYNYDTTD